LLPLASIPTYGSGEISKHFKKVLEIFLFNRDLYYYVVLENDMAFEERAL
jgi:hypothetical protein